jgi:hypothetical protein
MYGLMKTAEVIAIGGMLRTSIPLLALRYFVSGMAALFMLLVLVGLGCLLYGAGMWLSRMYGPEAGLMIIGMLSLCLAIALLGIGAMIIAYQKRRMDQFGQNLIQRFSEGIGSLDNEISQFAEKNPKLVLAISGLSGALLAKPPNRPLQ